MAKTGEMRREPASIAKRSREDTVLLRAIIENVIDGIITIDDKCVIESFNSAAERIFGYSAKEVIGKNVKMLMPSPYHEEHDGYVRSYLETGEAKIIGVGREVSGRRKDGESFPIDLAISEMRIGRERKFVGIIRDITKRKRAEDLIAQESQALLEMATAVAHQLNQPLNVIRLAAGNVLRKLDKGEEEPGYLRHKLKRIANQTRRAAAIIDHMRMFGREAGKTPILLDPREAILGALDLVGEQLRLAEIETVLDFPESCRPVLGHRVQMEQVILNLLTNARDAIRENPADAERTITLAVDDTGADAVRISVTDTGGGIPENALNRIFEPFYTTKELNKGTGLGLSVSYGIVRDMGGAIAAENAGGGARLTITLPVVGES
jgi:PAS domain S-box-containing protein